MPKADIIVLDDSFQYHFLNAYYKIILADYNSHTYKDKLKGCLFKVPIEVCFLTEEEKSIFENTLATALRNFTRMNNSSGSWTPSFFRNYVGELSNRKLSLLIQQKNLLAYLKN